MIRLTLILMMVALVCSVGSATWIVDVNDGTVTANTGQESKTTPYAITDDGYDGTKAAVLQDEARLWYDSTYNSAEVIDVQTGFISVDFRPLNSSGDADWGAIFMTASGSITICRNAGTDYRPRVDIQDADSNSLALIATSSLNYTDTWYSVALEYDLTDQSGSDNVKLYINGTLEASGRLTGSELLATGDSFFWGIRNYGGSCWYGTYDNMIIGVPEPVTSCIVLAGSACMLIRRRRK